MDELDVLFRIYALQRSRLNNTGHLLLWRCARALELDIFGMFMSPPVPPTARKATSHHPP